MDNDFIDTALLTLDNVTTGYGKKVIAQHLNATLRRGELVALLGPNGCGKSTLLRSMAALQPALGGKVSYDGKALTAYSQRELAQRISIVLTQRIEAEALTVEDVVRMGRIPYASFLSYTETAADDAAVCEAMALTQTEPFRQRMVSTLSDGERQRVFIAKSLAQHTPLILLDEPTAFLDFQTKVTTLRLLQQLAHKEQKAILLSTHDVELALHFCDQLWLLSTEGIEVGTPNQLAAQGKIAHFFAHEGIAFDDKEMRFTY